MKPIHAKPQSGRAIEPGLVLRIVSKRGRTVMFGQTGLLFANRQWGLLAEEQWVYPPLTPPTELLCVVAIHETTSNTTTPLANELGTVRFKIHNEFSSGNDGTNKSRCIIVCR